MNSGQFPRGKGRRVAILIETDDTWGRNVVDSISRYGMSRRWMLLICPRDGQRRLRLPVGWRGDGVLVSLRDSSMARHVRKTGLPAVDVSITMPEERWLGRVATDDDARARLAFEHFRARGLVNFATFAPPIGRYSPQRSCAFHRVVREAGFECSVYEGPGGRRQDFGDDHRRVSRWLKTLPQPLAVFAADPYPARQLLEVCQWEGLHVPEQVAILAGDTDELLCNIASPRISSIELASHQIGLEACRMLSRLISGKPVPRKPKLLRPLRVLPQQSTELLAINDPDLAQVLRYIRDHAAEGIRVSDLLRVFPVSRRTLEMRFRAELGRSPAEEIRHRRLTHARDLLLETDLSVEAVANASGICSGAQLASDFRKHFGIRPSTLREGRRLRA